MSDLKDEGIEILNSQLDRHTVVVWIWCCSQAAIEYIQTMYESNQLRDIFCDFTDIRSYTSDLARWNRVSIDCNQFKKTVGKFMKPLDMKEL